MHEKGLLEGELPNADQCHSGDEIGLPPNGEPEGTFTLGHNNLRHFVTGDKNPLLDKC